MNINELITIVKKKLQTQINIEIIEVQDKSFLHKNHAGNQKNKYHLKISINSESLKDFSKVLATKKIYKAISSEMSTYIHSIQLLINK